MPDNPRRRKHQQHGGVLFRKELVRKGQAAPPTPATSWKLHKNPSLRAVAAVAMATATGRMECEDKEGEEDYREDIQNPEGKTGSVWKDGGFDGMPTDLQEGPDHGVSFLPAPKLAAMLRDEFKEEDQSDLPVPMCNFLKSSPCSHLQPRSSSLSNSESPDSVNRHNLSKNSTRRPRIYKTFGPLSSPSPPLKVITLTSGGSQSLSLSSASSAADLCSTPTRKDSVDEHVGLLDKYNADAGCMASSCGRIKAFSRFSIESTGHSHSLVEATYGEELRRALLGVQQVEAAQVSARKEVDGLLRRCADEITKLRTKEQEKVQAAVLSIAAELEVEREARKNAEMESKRLANVVECANKVVVAAQKELEKERKARQLMEEVCKELANELGEDKAEVEELKRELAKARDELEEERKVLRVTEAWREERVQMKLADAKFELEERCITLNELKMELESFLNRQRVHNAGRRGKNLERAIKRLQEETFKPKIFQVDGKFQFLSHDDALASNICSSQSNAWSNIGSPTRHAYYKNRKNQSMSAFGCIASDFDRNLGLSKDTCKGSQLTNAQRNEQRFCHRKQASCRRRNEASMRSYRSKVKDLSSLGGRVFAEDCSDNSDMKDTGSQWGSSSDCKLSEQDEDVVNVEGCHDTGHCGVRDVVLWSMNEEGLDSSTCEAEELCSVKGRHEAQQRYQGVAGVERHHYWAPHSTHVFSQRRNYKTEISSEFLSITGPSPASKGHMPSPDVPMRNFHMVSPSNQSPPTGRRSVYRSGDWLKPYKGNSLHAKLLLEDKLFG